MPLCLLTRRQALFAAGVDTVQPPGIHALYLNAGRLLPHLASEQFPGHSWPASSILTAGSAARSWDLSTWAHGRNHRLVTSAPFELVRLAILAVSTPTHILITLRRSLPTSLRTLSESVGTESSRRRTCCATSR